jgi:hypothetical protein
MLFFDAFAFVQATLVFVAVAALGLRVAAVVAAETVEATGREPARRERPGAPSVEPAG